MTFRDVLTALGAAVLILPLMAAIALGLLVHSATTADHAAIAQALGAAAKADLGLPTIDQRRNGFVEGYFSDCIGASLMLREASAPSPLAAVIRSETILPSPDRTVCAELQLVLEGKGENTAWFTYARYWHGSLLLHRAVLSGGDHARLLSISASLVGATLLLLFGALAWRVGWLPALVVTAAMALLSDTVAVGGVPMLAVSVAALFACAAAFAVVGARLDGPGALIAAGVAGAAYNFFDFLCNPECLAMLCAWTWAARGVVQGRRRPLLDIALVFAAVLAGYGAFWAVKWVIAAFHAIGGSELYLFSVGDVDRWGPSHGAWAPVQAVGAILAQTFDAWWKAGIALALVAATVLAVRLRGRPMPDMARSSATLALPIVLGWLVIEAIAGHTLAHPAITFRIVPLSLGMILASALILSQIAPLSRKAAISPAP